MSALSLAAGPVDAVTAQPSALLQFTQEAPTVVALGTNTTWETDAVDLRENIDLDSTFVCPPNGKITEVWGNGVYTDGSSVCSAAVHAGLITTQEGGAVTIRTRPGQNGYGGAERNGVISGDYGSWLGSFIFLDSTAPAELEIGWDYGITDLRGRLDQSFTFICSPNGEIHNVWGSDLYTDDSSVCSAAVHAGLINVRDGGPVTVRMISGQGAYTSTSRNGVSTIGYGKWHGSFMFLR
ncbi:MAG: hypothetical protein HC800_08805 [Phormidesmis sp. RL_2_1]|nr:hypothetical protein [Phormidesmis sp. RL_2_1]